MKLFRAFATVGGVTMISRVLGFVRDVLIAFVLGTGVIADAFFVAFRFPNLFRRLFGEGAFNAAFIPLFSKRLEGEGGAQARQFAEEALSVLVWALLIFTALAEIFMPWLMNYVIAPGFSDTPEKIDLTILLTRIAFPYLLCLSLVALFSGILNSLGRFFVAAAAPILLNIVLIAVISSAYYQGFVEAPQAGVMLAWGVFVAGFLQLATVCFASFQAGMGLRLRRPRWTPAVRQLVFLGIPGVIAGGITQINLLIGTIIASLQDSAVSYLYYADRIYQLPLGVIGIAIGVVLLPDLSRRLRSGNMKSVHHVQNRSLEFALFLTLPAAVALFMISDPIIRVLFERGAFEWSDSSATAAALAAFAWGLPAFVLIKVFSPAYFAREDTKTPMIYAGISMVVNVLASLLFFFVIGHVGIAIATSIAGWLNAILLGVTLKRRGHFETDKEFRAHFPLLILSCLIMAVTLFFMSDWLGPWFAPIHGIFLQISALGLLIGAGLVSFLAAAHITHAVDLPKMIRSLTGR